MRRAAPIAVGFIVVATGLWAIGQVVARRIEGAITQEDGVFSIAAIWGGRTFASTAHPLLAGSARAVLGGVELDLTGAAPAAEGARLSLSTVLGGIHVLVPRSWRVEIAGEVRAGGVQVDVPRLETMPEDAPLLLVDVSGRAGGIAIEAA